MRTLLQSPVEPVDGAREESAGGGIEDGSAQVVHRFAEITSEHLGLVSLEALKGDAHVLHYGRRLSRRLSEFLRGPLEAEDSHALFLTSQSPIFTAPCIGVGPVHDPNLPTGAAPC